MEGNRDFNTIGIGSGAAYGNDSKSNPRSIRSQNQSPTSDRNERKGMVGNLSAVLSYPSHPG